MKGIFCQTTAETNEEYGKLLIRRNRWYAAGIFVGMAACVIAYAAQEAGLAGLSDYMLGVYCGAGCGIAVGCLILLIKNLLLLKNEGKLKASRLENSDERLKEISSRATAEALKVMLAVMFAGGLIGGIFYPVLVKALLVLAWVFVLSYIAAYHIWQHRM